jgi:glucose/arabinose dehydrogenase
VLQGFNAESRDPFSKEAQAVATTGAFAPFGTATAPQQRMSAHVPCTAAVLRCTLDGGDLEVVAWGLRNAYGLGFLPDGRLLAIDQGADDRGSRPIGDAPDLLYDVRSGAWYGWPDFIGGEPVTDQRYRPARGPDPCFLLSNHAALPPPQRALLRFLPHAAAVKFAVLPGEDELWPGQLLVALFGDEKPMTAPAGPREGRAIVRVDPADWSVHPVLLDGLCRPIDVAVDPRTSEIYILDFGSFEIGAGGIEAHAETGAVYRLVRRPAARRG